MSDLDSVGTVVRLAAKIGKSEDDALALLKKLKVPVTDGVFSERLLVSRLEQHTRKRDVRAPRDAACEHLAGLGFVIERVDAGRPTVLRLGATQRLLIGGREFAPDPSEGAFARLVLEPGHHITCILQIAARRTGENAIFNVTFDRTRKRVEADLYAFFVAEEDACWLIKRAELNELRRQDSGGVASSTGARPFSFFPLDEDHRIWRIAFGKGINDFSSTYRVERVPLPGRDR